MHRLVNKIQAFKILLNNSKKTPLYSSLFGVLVVSLCIWKAMEQNLDRPIINDEAVEFIQSMDMPLNAFHFLTPDTVYVKGAADVIETLVPYLNRLLSSQLFGFTSEEVFVRTVSYYYGMAYVLGVLLFSYAAWRLWGGFWPFAAGLSLGLSSYTLILTQVMTRNGITILWTSAIVMILVLGLSEKKQSIRWFCFYVSFALPILLVLGCWTYSSFKLLSIAVYGALFLDWLIRDRSLRSLFITACSLFFFIALLATLVTWDGSELLFYLRRGGLTPSSFIDYLNLLALTFASPWYHSTGQNPHFLTEDVHHFVGRGLISPWLSLFLLVGWIKSWRSSYRVVYVSTIICTLGALGCALGGPNAKYLFVFYPFLVLITLFGLREFLIWLEIKTKTIKWGVALIIVLFSGMVWGELRDVFVRFQNHPEHGRNKICERLATKALSYVEQGQSRVYIQPGLGFDIVYWKTLEQQRLGRISVHHSMDSLRKEFEVSPPPINAVLIIDYPAEETLKSLDSWSLPVKVKVVNIYDEKISP